MIPLVVCTAIISGVCVIREAGETPACRRISRPPLVAESRLSLQDGVERLARVVREKGGDTLKLARRKDERRGNMYHVEGWGFNCHREEK